MNRILVPTDFSENATNAIHFALKIAEKTGAKIFLFHANHIPIVTPDASFSAYEMATEMSEKAAKERMESLKEQLIDELKIIPGKIEIEGIVEIGFAVEEIIESANKRNIDLIIMATKGASGVTKALLGTNTERVIKTSNCPVLLIPEGCTYKGFDTILLATDYNKIKNNKTLALLEELALLYDSKVLIFNAQPEKEYVPSYDEAIEGLSLEGKFSHIPHQYFFAEEKKPIEAIDEFIEEKNPDLLVLLPHIHSFIEKIFSKSVTSELAFHTKIPLLTLPDINEMEQE